MGNPDPDAQLVMGVLLASPRRDDPGALLAAARAYEAIRSARERGAIPPPHNPLCFSDRPGFEHDNECECWCHDRAEVSA